MIIPCNFDTEIVDASFAPVQADARLESAGLGDCNLFRIPFRLPVPCDVIMPRAKRQKPVKGTPRELMSRLESLSGTSCFDVYFRFDTYAQLELRRMFDSVARQQLKTPNLLLESMYDGRGGGVNLWLNQGLDLDLELDSKRCQSYPDSPQKLLPPPPPYTQATIPSLDLNESHHSPSLVAVQVPCSDAGLASISMHKHGDDEGVPETPFHARMQRILDYRSPSIEYPRRSTFKRAASVDSLSDARQRKRNHVCRSPLVGPLIREASAPVTLDEATAPAAHHEGYLRYDRSGEIASARLELQACEANAPLPVHLDKVTTATSHERDPPSSRAEEVACWLYTAWTVLPSAHHTLRPQLLALGSACDTTSFAALRIDISTALAFAAARTPSNEADTPLLTISDAEREVRGVVAWVNGARPDADSMLVKDLVTLAGAAMDVVDSVSDKEENMERFLVIKARCIGLACVLGGDVV
jgi:hypothetical protein